MALIEMDFATGIGEHYEETLLYENASPSSTPSSGNLALNDDYTKYDLIKIKFRNYVSGTADTAKYVKTVYMTPADIKENKNTEGYAIVGFSRKGANTVVCNFLGEGTSDSNVYFYVIDSYIHILSIYGLKKVGGSESNIGYKEFDITIPANTKLDLSIPTEKRAKRIIGNLYNMSTTSNTYSIDASDGDTKTKRLWNLPSLGTQLNVTFTDNSINLVQASGTTFSANNYKFLGMILY